jgi:disulfide bond formation protein DsbB
MSDAAKAAAWTRAAEPAALFGGLTPGVIAFVVAAGSAVIVAMAQFFEHVLLIAPCPLCLEQRKFHYVVIPLALVAGVAALRRAPKKFVAAGLVLVALVLLAGAAIAGYHAGVEWKLWAGPADCSGPIKSFGQAGSLLQQMQATSVVRCDEPGWRFLGLSLAGYNAIVSVVMAALAACGAAAEARR